MPQRLRRSKPPAPGLQSPQQQGEGRNGLLTLTTDPTVAEFCQPSRALKKLQPCPSATTSGEQQLTCQTLWSIS